MTSGSLLNVRLLQLMLLVALELLQNAAASAPGDCSVEDDMFSQYMDHGSFNGPLVTNLKQSYTLIWFVVLKV